MSCQNHPNKESVANCQFCGKELCEECAISIAGKNYCEDCMSDLVGPELANITRKIPSSEVQETTVTNQRSSKGEPSYANKAQTPLNEKPIVREKEQEIPSQNSQNINNMNDTGYDDIYSDDRLYNDIHGNETPSTPQSNKKIEEKYEKYLDDLYFDENPEIQGNTGTIRNGKLSLSEQLAQDEARHGPITQEPFVPEEPVATEEFSSENNRNKNVPIMENLRNTNPNHENRGNETEYTASSLHRGSIHYKKEEKKPYSSGEKVLTVVLILMIILVAIYIIYLLTLQDQYPSILQAITAFFGNPWEVLSQIFS